MTDTPNPQSGNADESSGGPLATVTDLVESLVVGGTIPAPIRKNFFKAFGQLCSAAIDVPVAYLEGVAAEKRAEAQARVKIISTGADQIARQMQMDLAFARAAVKKYGQKIIREQVNLDQVAAVAARELLTSSTGTEAPTAEVPPIDDDWLNTFEKEACQKSTEEMQLLFGKLLAGEIRRPSSFSLKTVKLMGELDSRVASLFQRLASLTVSLRAPGAIIDARVVSFSGSAAQNSLQDYGLGFGTLNVLNEFGLIIPDYNSYVDYRPSISVDARVSSPFIFQGSPWALVPQDEGAPPQALRLNGVALSVAGKELLSIVDVLPNEKYLAALQSFFHDRKLTMVSV